MRLFLNYDKEDKSYLTTVANILKEYKVDNIAATSRDLNITSLIETAKQTSSDAILISNPVTLEQCVQGDKISLDQFRGSRLNFSVPALVINKLEHIHTVSHGEWLLRNDFAKLHKIKEPVQQFTYKMLDNSKAFDEAWLQIQQSILIVYDVETTDAGNGLITSCAYSCLMSDMTWRNYVVPFIGFGQIHYISDEEFGQAINFIREVNALPIPKCCHSGNYDNQYAIKYRAPLDYWCLDTLILWQCWYAELPKDLSFVASVCLYDFYQWKYELAQSKRNKDIISYWAYNAKDTWYTGRCLLWILENMPTWAVKNYQIKFPKVFPALYCNFEGILVDKEKHKELRDQSEKKLLKAEKNLKIMAADPMYNPGSPKQTADLLFNIIGAKRTIKWDKKDRKKKESDTTDEKALAKISAQHPLLARICDDILDYRKGAKAIGTYFDADWLNDRIMYSILVAGTETDRFACHQSAFYAGAQVQNIPGKDSKSKINARGFLCADPGYELIEADKNKSEARCVAYLSQCLSLIEALETPDKDFYKILATIFFGLTYEQVSKDLRNNVVKRIIHGTNYMMKEDTFIETATATRLYEAAGLLNFTVTDLRVFAAYLLNLYHEKFPEVKEWYEEVKTEIRETQKLVSALGVTRYFFGNISKSPNLLRGAIAHVPQNLSVHVINDGFEAIYKELVLPSNGDIRLKFQNHDSIMSQVKLGLRMYYVENVERLCNTPVIVKGRTMNIPVDFKIGTHWDEMQEYKYNSTTKELLAV